MKFNEIKKLKEEVLIKHVKKEYQSLNKRYKLALQSIQRTQEALQHVEFVEQLVTKIGELAVTLKETTNSISKLTHTKYYGAQYGDIPQAVHLLADLNYLLYLIKQSVDKLKNHLNNQTGRLWQVEHELEQTEYLLKWSSGFRRHIHFLGYLNVFDSKNTRENLLEPKRRIAMLQLQLDYVTHLNKFIEEDIELSKEDIKLIEHSLILVHKIGSHLKHNKKTWQRDVSYGQFTGDYTSEIINVSDALNKLRNYLEFLSKDEQFILATEIKIKNTSKNDTKLLDDIRRISSNR